MATRDWWVLLSLYQNALVVPVAVVLFILLVRAKTARRRALFASLLVLAWLPHIQVFLGNVYFDYLCRHEAGEFIYRTVDNVEGILQMRPRDGSKDYFDRMREGDIPEDPWGHTNAEAQEPWLLFRRYKFLEKPATGALAPRYPVRENWHASMITEPPADPKYVRFFGYDGSNRKSIARTFVSNIRSTYGYSWRQTAHILPMLLNVYPGEFTVVDLSTGEILARKKGALRIRPMRLCGGPKDESFAYDFVSKVLIPGQ